ncbi:hypothetical protein SDJN03_23724, partial [Cucurbita argyrosperma subsp. sororia]
MLASEPESNIEPGPNMKSAIGCEAESFPKSEDKLEDSAIVEAELLDKSMDVAKEREAYSDDVGLSESRDVLIVLENCTKDEHDVADEGDKLVWMVKENMVMGWMPRTR